MLVKVILTATLGVFSTGILIVLRLCAEELRKDRVPVLLYHRLLSEEDIARGVSDNERIYVSYTHQFEEQMKYLFDQGYNPISIDYFVASTKGEKSYQKNR